MNNNIGKLACVDTSAAVMVMNMCGCMLIWEFARSTQGFMCCKWDGAISAIYLRAANPRRFFYRNCTLIGDGSERDRFRSEQSEPSAKVLPPGLNQS